MMDPHKFKKHVETPNLGVSNWVIIQNGLFIKLGYSSKWVINQNGLLFEMSHYSKFWNLRRPGWASLHNHYSGCEIRDAQFGRLFKKHFL